MKRISTPGGWRYLDDSGRISRVYVADVLELAESFGVTDGVEWLTGAAAIVARLEWEASEAERMCDSESESYACQAKDVRDIDECLAIARAELDRERATCKCCGGRGVGPPVLVDRKCPACAGTGKSNTDTGDTE